MRKSALITLIALLVPAGLSAARLTLRDGSVVYGNFVSGTPRTIVFQDNQGLRRTFNLREVGEIDFAAGTSAERYYPNREPAPPPPQPPERYYPNREPAPPPPQPVYQDDVAYNRDDRHSEVWNTLHPGTQLFVRVNETINPQTAAEGRSYSASIAQDVVDGQGNLMIPRGSDAALVIRRIDDGGSFVLDLDSIRINGRRYLVDTSDIRAGDRRGVGANRRTAEMVGGGVQVLTRGREIRVPAETVLNFRLEEPLHLHEAR